MNDPPCSFPERPPKHGISTYSKITVSHISERSFRIYIESLSLGARKQPSTISGPPLDCQGVRANFFISCRREVGEASPKRHVNKPSFDSQNKIDLIVRVFKTHTTAHTSRSSARGINSLEPQAKGGFMPQEHLTEHAPIKLILADARGAKPRGHSA